jgi:hypothetical protein
MTSDVQRDQPMHTRQARIHLKAPLEPTLRGTVDKQDRTTLSVSCFYDVELDTTTACHSVRFHLFPPPGALVAVAT